MITFKDARAIAEKAYFAQAELEGFEFEPWVADWGFENEKYFQVTAGDRRWLEGGDQEIRPIDGIIRLVDKQTGIYSETTALEIFDMLATFVPVGNAPNDDF